MVSQLPPSQLEKLPGVSSVLKRHATRISLNRGGILYSAGDSPDGLFLVESGTLVSVQGVMEEASSSLLPRCVRATAE